MACLLWRAVVCDRRSCPETTPPVAQQVRSFITGVFQPVERLARPDEIGREHREPESNRDPAGPWKDQHRDAGQQKRKSRDDPGDTFDVMNH